MAVPTYYKIRVQRKALNKMHWAPKIDLYLSTDAGFQMPEVTKLEQVHEVFRISHLRKMVLRSGRVVAIAAKVYSLTSFKHQLTGLYGDHLCLSGDNAICY